MPDPIRGLSPAIPIEVTQTGQAGTAPAAAQPGQSRAASTVDSADVARAEALLATISTAAATVPTIDQARVAALREAIQSGTYQVNPQQIAQKILEIEGLLSTGGGAK